MEFFGHYKIYQLKAEAPTVRFATLQEVRASGKAVTKGNYHLVYFSQFRDQIKDIHAFLETLWVKFNTDNRPNGDTMKSLSMGDVVVIKNAQDDRSSVYYCDAYGFAQIDAGEWEPQAFFGIVRWTADDVMGISGMSDGEALLWWARNEDAFRSIMKERGIEVLSDMLPARCDEESSPTYRQMTEKEFSAIFAGDTFYVRDIGSGNITAKQADGDAYFNHDCDEPTWEVQANDGATYAIDGVMKAQ